MGNDTRDWKNITYDEPQLVWDSKDVPGSLQKVKDYAEGHAAFAMRWYYKKKAHKARFSRFFRYGAIVCTSLAGMLPVINGAWPGMFSWLIAPGNQPLLVSLAVGLAATMIAVDRFAGYSTAWIRYIRAGADINKRLHEYRLDWIKLIAEAGGDTTTQAANLLARTREFVNAIQGIVIQETQAWATEFESSLADMEKSAKEQSEKQVQELQTKLDSVQPGSLFVTVSNLSELDGGKFTVALFSNKEKIAEAVDQTGVWQQLALSAGIYTIHLSALLGGVRILKTLGVTIESGKPKHENVPLQKAAAAGASAGGAADTGKK
jgi:hypothetical protein